MGLFDFMNKKQVSQTNKTETIEIDGYIIDKNSGELIDAPIGREVYNIPDEVTKISPKAQGKMKSSCKKLVFSDNSLLKESPKLPYGEFLSGFDNITEVRLPKGLEKLEKFFDKDCKTKIDFVFSPNLKEMGRDQFPPHWEELIVPNGVNFSNGIVSHNSTLKKVVIPSSMKSLEDGAINQMLNLKTLILEEGISKMGETSLWRLARISEIYIPDSLKDFYLPVLDESRMFSAESREKYHDSVSQSNYCNEQLKISKEQILNLYKTINGKIYHFKIPRGQFESMSIVENKVLINGNLSIDINSLSQEMYIDVINKTIKNTQSVSNSNQTQTSINNSSNIPLNGKQEVSHANETVLKYEEMLLTLEQEKNQALQSGNGALYLEKEIEIAKNEFKIMYGRFKNGDESISNIDILNKRIEIEKLKITLNERKWNDKLISFAEYEENGNNIEEILWDLEDELKSYSNSSGKHR